MHTLTEAAQLLGMSRSQLDQLCDEGRIETTVHDGSRHVPAAEIARLLAERARADDQAEEAARSAEQRRRARAAQALDY